MIRGVGERRAHRIAGGNRGRREWMWNMELGWERIGAGGMQHSNNGAVLGATGGAGRGRRVPGPSPALFLSYTNSPASTPSAEPKGRRGEKLKRGSRVHVHIDLSTHLDARHPAPDPQGRATDRNREGPIIMASNI